MPTMRKLRLSNLLLAMDNPRFALPAKTQREAIAKMMDLEKAKIMRLAKDIAANGLDPSENIMVHCPDSRKKEYTVVEGNRRITALKILQKPTLVPSERDKKALIKIKRQGITLPNQIICSVFDDDSFERWVELKHTGENNGIGRASWTTPEQARYSARKGKQNIQHQAYTFMLSREKDYAEILDSVKLIRITNLERLFGDPAVRETFGLLLKNGELFCQHEPEKFISDYKKLLMLMIERRPDGRPAFTVDRIRSKQDRLNFLRELAIEAAQKKVERPWSLLNPQSGLEMEEDPSFDTAAGEHDAEDSTEGETSEEVFKQSEESGDDDNTDRSSDRKGVPCRPPNADRNFLIPANIKLHFGDNKKCSRIFSELKSSLDFRESPNSIAVMLRIFIDLSVTYYVTKNSLKNEKDPKRDPGLYDKIQMSAEHLRKNQKIKQHECSSVLAHAKQSTRRDGTLQQYVHNPNFIADKIHVNTEWDNIEPLIKAIWSRE